MFSKESQQHIDNSIMSLLALQMPWNHCSGHILDTPDAEPPPEEVTADPPATTDLGESNSLGGDAGADPGTIKNTRDVDVRKKGAKSDDSFEEKLLLMELERHAMQKK